MCVLSVIIDITASYEYLAFHNSESEWVSAIGDKINALEGIFSSHVRLAKIKIIKVFRVPVGNPHIHFWCGSSDNSNWTVLTLIE